MDIQDNRSGSEWPPDGGICRMDGFSIDSSEDMWRQPTLQEVTGWASCYFKFSPRVRPSDGNDSAITGDPRL